MTAMVDDDDNDNELQGTIGDRMKMKILLKKVIELLSLIPTTKW